VKLEIGKRYKNGRGEIAKIGGHTTIDKRLVYSLGGDWYEQETGHFVFEHGHGTWKAPKTWRSLVEEVP